MPWGLQHFHQSRQTHFVTFCCYHRRKLLADDASCRVFESALERVRRSYRLYIYGYVVMPEHVHLLLSEPQLDDSSQVMGGPLKPALGLSGSTDWLTHPQPCTLADALKSLKQGVSRRLITSSGGPFKPDFGLSGEKQGGPFKPDFGLSGEQHFWQKRYYDFNIRNHRQFVEKLRYIHHNPVQAGLCERPEDWTWSSFRHYGTASEGRVEIESEWTARKRERAAGRLCPAVELPHSSQRRA